MGLCVLRRDVAALAFSLVAVTACGRTGLEDGAAPRPGDAGAGGLDATVDAGGQVVPLSTACGEPSRLTRFIVPQTIDYSIPYPNGSTVPTHPGSIVVGADGSMWVTTFNSTLFRLTTDGVLIPIPGEAGATVEWVGVGADGTLWYQSVSYDSSGETYDVGRMSPEGDVLAHYPLPNAEQGGFGTGGCDSFAANVSEPGENLWIVSQCPYYGLLYRMTPTGEVTSFTLPTIDVPAGSPDFDGGAVSLPSFPSDIVTTSDGHTWIAASAWPGPWGSAVTQWPGPAIEWIGDLSDDGRIRRLEFPLDAGFVNPGGSFTQARDGDFWIGAPSYPDGVVLARVTSDGGVTEFPIPNSSAAAGSFVDDANVTSIATGPDGNVWFQADGFALSRVTASGEIEQFTELGIANGIATGPDGNLWYSTTIANEWGLIVAGAVVRLEFNPACAVDAGGG